jgi:hypothetical protein
MIDMVMDEAITLATQTGDYWGLALMSGVRAERLKMLSEDYTATFRDAQATLALAECERWELICDWSLHMKAIVA